MTQLVLSIFPGGGLLDYAFEQEGFCVVRGPDVIWGGDIRRFHPPAGRFDGLIGGDPCQSHSSLANLVRAKGLEPSFPDMTPEFQRVVEAARPRWFLRENVPRAPEIKPAGYDVRSFLLDNASMDSGDGTGNEQMRRRRFWFGVRDGTAPELRAHMDFALFELPREGRQGAVQGGHGEPPWQRERVTAVGGNDGTADAIQGYRNARKRQTAVTADERAASVTAGGGGQRKRTASVTGRSEGRVGSPTKDYSPPRRSLGEMLRLQGLPPDWFDHQPWTMQARRKIVGNGVAVPLGRQLAAAIREATQ